VRALLTSFSCLLIASDPAFSGRSTMTFGRLNRLASQLSLELEQREI
jgi:hypothetical protein